MHLTREETQIPKGFLANRVYTRENDALCWRLLFAEDSQKEVAAFVRFER